MAENENIKKNPANYILVGLLLVAAFLIGTLYNKVKTLEKGGTGQQAGGPTVASSPTPRPLTVSDDDPSLGSQDAKVTVVIFADYQCPFCGAFAGYNQEVIKAMQKRDPSWQPTETNLIKDYVKTGKVRLVFKDYPFLDQMVATKESRWAGEATWCAKEQGKFWEYHDYLFAHQKGENEGAFSKENLKKFAASLGLKKSDFDSCLESGKYEKKMNEAIAFGQSVGVNGTPAIFIKGKLIPGGAIPYSMVKPIIEEELKK